MMVDADVAYLSPSCVYRVRNDADLLYGWKRSRRVGGEAGRADAPEPALAYGHHVPARGGCLIWYFLVTVLDGYSRYAVHWELLTSMRAANVQLVVQHAPEASGVKKVEIVGDNGSQFTSADFSGNRQLPEKTAA